MEKQLKVILSDGRSTVATFDDSLSEAEVFAQLEELKPKGTEIVSAEVIDDKKDQAALLRAEAKDIASGEPMSFEEQREAYYAERNPVTGALSKLGEIVAPKAFESAITGKPTSEWAKNATKEGLPIILSTIGGGGGAMLGTKLGMKALPALGAMSGLGSVLGENLGEQAVSLSETGELKKPETNDYIEAGAELGLNTVLPGFGKWAGSKMTKAASGLSDSVFDIIKESPLFAKISMATKGNIDEVIKNKIDDIVKNYGGKHASAEIVEEDTERILSELVDKQLILPSDLTKTRNAIRNMLGTNPGGTPIQDLGRKPMKEIVAERPRPFWADTDWQPTGPQAKPLIKPEGEQYDTAAGYDLLQNRLKSIRGGQKYVDSDRYVDPKAKARTILADAVERSWITDEAKLADLKALQKATGQNVSGLTKSKMGLGIVRLPNLSVVGPELYNISQKGFKAGAKRTALPNIIDWGLED